MPVLVLPIAITGSGKSRLGDDLARETYIDIVCMDDLRKDLTGSFSDQSKNNEVWSKAQATLKNLIQKGLTVYFSATNLSGSQLSKDIERYMSWRPDLKIILVPFKDSYDPELCQSRVAKDIDAGLDRADTRDQSIIDRQFQKFLATVDAISDVCSVYPEVSVIEYDGSNGDEVLEAISP